MKVIISVSTYYTLIMQLHNIASLKDDDNNNHDKSVECSYISTLYWPNFVFLLKHEALFPRNLNIVLWT